MADTLSSFTTFDFDRIMEDCAFLEVFEVFEAGYKEKPRLLLDKEAGQANLISISKNGRAFSGEDETQHGQYQKPKSNDESFDEFRFNTVFQPTQPIDGSTRLEHIPTRGSEILERNRQMPPPSLVSLELLRKYRSGLKKLNGLNLSNKSVETHAVSYKLSTEEIMRVAGARYVQFPTQMYDDYYTPVHPFGLALSGLSEDEKRDVELAHLLLAAAEKVGCEQYDRATKLLLRCEWISSARANSLQRVVFHFVEALQQRVEKKSGRTTVVSREGNIATIYGHYSDLKFVEAYKQVPFTQMLLFTGIQAIIENTASERKIHLIDMGIRCGVQWTILMQALVARQDNPIELLKITAVGTTAMEETGKRLATVAESLNLPFSFKSVLVSNMNDVKERLFQTENDEAVIVFAPHVLGMMISRSNCLENLMRVIRKLNPTIMVVMETEANLNSPSFFNRFVETLFFYSAYYDSLETCMKGNDDYRMKMEKTFGEGIRVIVAEEGSERIVRNVPLDVWRAFFQRFGMVEIGISESSSAQGALVVEQFPCRSSCAFDKNGKSLVVGWKGTPIHSLSFWKFRPTKGTRF